MSPRRRRRAVAPLQAGAIAARRGGFWRISDRVIPCNGRVGSFESVRLVIF